MPVFTGNKGFFLFSAVETLKCPGLLFVYQFFPADEAAGLFLILYHRSAIPANLVILSITSLKFLMPEPG
jgi:hypothetical protein